MRYVLFPYERVEKGAKCVLYGMGWLGKLFLQQIATNSYCDIIYAVDHEYEKIKSSLVPVKSPMVLKDDSDYEYIVIAILDASTAEKVAEKLSELNIPKHKIIYRYSVMNVDQKPKNVDWQRIDWLIRDQICRMLYGLESYTQNEFLKEKNIDWENWAMYQRAKKLLEALRVYGISDPHKFIRVGRASDGGYLLVSPPKAISGRLLYGFGVGDDISFEVQMAENGYDVFLYDHTVNGLPQHHSRICFQKIGLLGVEDDKQPEMSTLAKLLEQNGHLDEQNIILKMDIEGAELDVLLNLPEGISDKFAQIVMEIHNLTDEENWENQIKMLEKINRTHKLVHLHVNNYSRVRYLGNLMISEAVEVTYVRARDFHFEDRKGFLLRENDYRCDAMYRPERLTWQE